MDMAVVLTAAAVGTGLPSAMDIASGDVSKVTGRRTSAVKVESHGK